MFFLDYPLEICLEGIKERKGKTRTDIPWVESDDEDDPEFVEFIKNYKSYCIQTDSIYIELKKLMQMQKRKIHSL